MARYVGQLLAPAEAFGQRFFSPSGASSKKRTYYAFLVPFGHFWCSVVTLVTFELKSKKKVNYNNNNNNIKKNNIQT